MSSIYSKISRRAYYIGATAGPIMSGPITHHKPPFSQTVNNDDGTYDAQTLEKMDFQRGYAVGMIQGSAYEVCCDDRLPTLMRSTAIRYMPKYVGLWTDEDTHMKHIDPVRVIYDQEVAESVGRENNQISIWDFENGVEIRL